MTVASVLKQKGNAVVTVPPAATVQEVANIITSQRIGAVVVVSAPGKLIGIVSERDVVKAIAGHASEALTMTAADIMTRDVTTATIATTMDEAMDIMDAGYFRHLPVLHDDELVGIISIRDVVKTHLQHRELEVDTLKSYVYRGAV